MNHPWRHLILALARELDQAGIPYSFEASTALLIQGLQLSGMDDIDLSVQWGYMQKAHDLFLVFRPTPVTEHEGWVKFSFTREGIPVDVLSYESTVMADDPDRREVIEGDQRLWCKSMDFFYHHSPPGHPRRRMIEEFQAAEKPFTSFGLFYDAAHSQVLLHLRSVDAPVNPSKWALFGGSSEEGETPVDCFCREIREELGLQLDADEVRPIQDYYNAKTARHRHVFVVERFIPPDSIVLGEGAGFAWIPVTKALDYDLTDASRSDLEFFLASIRYNS